ncbi:glycoside hydrolase [Asticcacaulis sp. AC460]|uniref:glycoside hydrolase family 16 protein n=1 Tax=Asticcacaulis sp. AC460 TaxID=1282360 RepID=UPI0003C3DBC9|nr:glycoside hydrolase family 16 protein [Asticcacaulis sp. AC460]ESQ92146.1 glycoside hydrolase [Asticcacaulis sp. AC460]
MKSILVAAVMAAMASAAAAQAPTGYKLVWSDEFDTGTAPDPAKWDYDVTVNKTGWYNNEAQYYSAHRAENSRIENGNLIIEARKDDLSMMADWGGQHYSSVRLVTRGRADWTYGFFDIRAKLPCGRGQWPAIWLLGNGQWPATGEIDIMEYVGFDATTIYGNTHSPDTVAKSAPQGGKTELADPCTAFHNYQAEWTKDSITFLLDGKAYYHRERPKNASKEVWPYDVPEYLILNTAIGGNWGGQQGIDDTVFPTKFEIDYVRVYQK